MPADPSPRLLGEVLARTLEEAAFAFAEASPDLPALAGALLEARLRYVGRHAGELRLVAPERTAAALAASVLGEDGGSLPATIDVRDALGELLNMVAGAVAVELFGRDARCVLGLPQVERTTAEEHERRLGTAAAAVRIQEEGGGRLDLCLHRLAGSAA